MRGGHGQKFVILMVKMKEFFSWGGHVPNVLPQPTGLSIKIVADIFHKRKQDFLGRRRGVRVLKLLKQFNVRYIQTKKCYC